MMPNVVKKKFKCDWENTGLELQDKDIIIAFNKSRYTLNKEIYK